MAYMKRISVVFAAFAVCVLLFTAARPKTALRQVKFHAAMDCKNCVKKVVENVSFEKGVEDLKAELSDKSVTIVYNPAKTDTLKLGDAIRKLGYKAKVVEDKAL